jgi:hypothetical protein
LGLAANKLCALKRVGVATMEVISGVTHDLKPSLSVSAHLARTRREQETISLRLKGSQKDFQ